MASPRSRRHTIVLSLILLSIDTVLGHASPGNVRRRELETSWTVLPVSNQQEDGHFWEFVMAADASVSTNHPSFAGSSSPSHAPTPRPTPTPTIPSITASPTHTTTTKPSILPTDTPTGGPTAATETPTQLTESPSVVPSESPSVVPSSNVTLAPSTLSPSGEPSSSPTVKLCDAELNLRCLAEDLRTNCEDILPEDNLSCGCADCVRELVFVYTATACEDVIGATALCTDSAAVNATARVVVTGGEATLFEGTVEIGDNVEIRREDGECLSEALTVKVLSPEDNSLLQTILVDATCDVPEALTLLDSYGAFDFIGYSCNSSDVHNCFNDVTYLLATCNDNATEELVLFELDFDINGDTVDLLEGNSLRFLDSNECLQSFIESKVDRCSRQEFVATAFLNASTDLFGELCQQTAQLSFDLFANSSIG